MSMSAAVQTQDAASPDCALAGVLVQPPSDRGGTIRAVGYSEQVKGEITAELRRNCASFSSPRALRGVRLTIGDNHIILSGLIPTVADEHLLLTIAAQAASGRTVFNRLQIP